MKITIQEHPVTIEVAELFETDMDYNEKLWEVVKICDSYPLMDIEEE